MLFSGFRSFQVDLWVHTTRRNSAPFPSTSIRNEAATTIHAYRLSSSEPRNRIMGESALPGGLARYEAMEAPSPGPLHDDNQAWTRHMILLSREPHGRKGRWRRSPQRHCRPQEEVALAAQTASGPPDIPMVVASVSTRVPTAAVVIPGLCHVADVPVVACPDPQPRRGLRKTGRSVHSACPGGKSRPVTGAPG